jgi:hypothetical protein
LGSATTRIIIPSIFRNVRSRRSTFAAPTINESEDVRPCHVVDIKIKATAKTKHRVTADRDVIGRLLPRCGTRKTQESLTTKYRCKYDDRRDTSHIVRFLRRIAIGRNRVARFGKISGESRSSRACYSGAQNEEIKNFLPGVFC